MRDVLMWVTVLMLASSQAWQFADAIGSPVRISDSGQIYWVEEIETGLKMPSSMAWLPNGDILITERAGDLRVIRAGTLDPAPLRGVPESCPDEFSHRNGGLREIVIDPEFAINKKIYLLLCEGTYAQRFAAVYSARYASSELTDVKRVLRTKDGIGGPGVIATRMLMLTDKTLLIAVAEDHKERAQELGSHVGKILRINRDGSLPTDNPFLDTQDALPEIWTYGHKVVTGLYQDSDSGKVYEVEPGPRGGDELNLLKPGANYGWGKASWGFTYDNRGAEGIQTAQGIENPILIWMPSYTPSGIAHYQGTKFPKWKGDYFVGHLGSTQLERLRMQGGRVVAQERMLFDLQERIRDVKEGSDGYIYMISDSGRLLRLKPGAPGPDERRRVALKTSLPPFKSKIDLTALTPQDIEKGRKSFIALCVSCHRLGDEIVGADIGPNLDGVFHSIRGRRPDYDYSRNLRGTTNFWDSDSLDEFLENPDGFMPGTKMTSGPIADENVRRRIIGFLKWQKER